MTALADLRPALRAYVLADAAVAALCGTRMYPGALPQGVTAPSLVYQEVASSGDHHTAGPSGLARTRMQVTAWARSWDLADQLARAVKARLDGMAGAAGSGDAAVTVQGAFFDGSRDIADDQAKLCGKAMDFIVWFVERA
jgi:hypothetical protein